MINNTFVECIEQLFSAATTFEKTSCCEISRNGDGIDQIILKIELPELPYNIKYKPNCIYDLLDEIRLEIGGTIFFKYNSQELQQIDILEHKFDSVKKMNSGNNNTIYYPINLREIFGKFESKNDHINISDINYLLLSGIRHGIRLCNMDRCSVKLYVKFSSIWDIIENKLNIESNFAKEISKLEIYDCNLLVQYYHMREINKADNNIKQKMTMWHCQSFQDEIDPATPSVKYRLCFDPVTEYRLTEFVVVNKSNHKIQFFNLQINGVNCFSRSQSADMTKIYQYNKSIELDENVHAVYLETTLLLPSDTVQLNIWFDTNVNYCDISVLAKIETNVVYADGKLVIKN